MGNNLQEFEVRVRVKRKGSRHFSFHVNQYIEDSIIKMFHKNARTHKLAMRMCEKYGRPISAHKVDAERIAPLRPSSLLADLHHLKSPYPNAVAMDEMVWRKNKRAERIEEGRRDKDKGGH